MSERSDSGDPPGHGERQGQVVGGRYRLLRPVGAGGMGVVYEAEHVYIHRRVALKLLPAGADADEEATERLRREAEAIGRIHHPNIVRVEDFGRTEDGAVYLAMEWLDGRTLDQVLSQGPLELTHAVDLLRQICAGLEAAHAAGVVHRDLKPSNVILVAEGGREVAKVVDFGVAKLLREEAQLTRTGMFVGTPFYVAPEQALGNHISPRVDLYALGIMAYEMLTGEVPFSGSNVMAILHRHVDEPPALDPLPEKLRPIIGRCLAKTPEERYPDAAALRHALEGVIAGRVTAERVVLDDELDFEPLRRPRWGRWAALAVLLAGAGAAGWYAMERRGAGGGGAAPTPVTSEWQRAGAGAGFTYTASISPAAPEPNQPALLSVTLSPTDPALAERLRSGRLEARIQLLDARADAAVVTLSRQFDPSGALTEPARLTAPRAGTHRVVIDLLGAGGPARQIELAMCVGADPLGDRAALARVCPELW